MLGQRLFTAAEQPVIPLELVEHSLTNPAGWWIPRVVGRPALPSRRIRTICERANGPTIKQLPVHGVLRNFTAQEGFSPQEVMT